jgi:hypothetical protein
MIKNFECKLINNPTDISAFRLKWKWIKENDKELPALNILYRTLDENEILQNSLFDGGSIIKYMSEEISMHGVENCINNTGRYRTKEYALNKGMITTIFVETDIKIENFDCVYFFCMIDKNRNIFRCWAEKAVSQSTIGYSEKKKGKIFSKQRIISVEKEEPRRIILRTGYEKNFSYSLLPSGCQEYYIQPDTPTNYKLIYLSELINI